MIWFISAIARIFLGLVGEGPSSNIWVYDELDRVARQLEGHPLGAQLTRTGSLMTPDLFEPR